MPCRAARSPRRRRHIRATGRSCSWRRFRRDASRAWSRFRRRISPDRGRPRSGARRPRCRRRAAPPRRSARSPPPPAISPARNGRRRSRRAPARSRAPGYSRQCGARFRAPADSTSARAKPSATAADAPHHLGFRDAERVIGGLQAAIVQQRDLHGGVGRQRLAQQAATRACTSSACSGVRIATTSLRNSVFATSSTKAIPPSAVRLLQPVSEQRLRKAQRRARPDVLCARSWVVPLRLRRDALVLLAPGPGLDRPLPLIAAQTRWRTHRRNRDRRIGGIAARERNRQRLARGGEQREMQSR